MAKRSKSIVVFVFILFAVVIPLSVFAASTTSGGITLFYPDNAVDCSPTFDISTTGIDPSWPVQWEIFEVVGGNLIHVDGALTTGDLAVQFTPAPLVAGESRTYAVTVAVFVPSQALPTKLSGKWTVTCEEPPPPPGEGCTPGYWKNHPESWPFDPGTPFSDVFADAFPGLSMMDVAWLGGADLEALGRHAVAAYLNALDGSGVEYGLSASDVVQMFNDAFAGNLDIEETKDIFEWNNELGCPLD